MPRAFDAGFAPGFGAAWNFGTLILKVGTTGPDPAYQDGDIICAFNRRRTRSTHAQVICSPRTAARNGHGLIDLSHHSRDWFEQTHQYRFTRVSAGEVLRTDLLTTQTTLLSATPNAAGEAIDVPLFIARRLQRPTVAMFGSTGAETWYGGDVDDSDAKLTAVWAAIESKTPLREADYADWPAGSEELKTMLCLRVNDFDDAEQEALAAPVMDLTNPENPVMVRRRTRMVNWRGLPDMTAQRIAQIEDRGVSVDIRAERKHALAVIVGVK